MKLQFGVLWIEDSYSQQEEDEIKAGAATAGFEIEITHSKDGAELENFANDQQRYHCFDLVLLDLNLANGVKGDKLAGEVRSRFRSIPILFYTGSEGEPKLRERMAREKIEGVFCAHRTNGIKFTQRASELIQDYSHAFDRLSGMRGLAMEVVAEVDLICRDAVTQLGKIGFDDHAKSYIDKAVQDQMSGTLEEFPALASLEERMNHPAADSMKSFKTFRHLAGRHIKTLPKGDTKDELSRLMLDTRKYDQEVIKIRNILGHALEKRNETGWQILDKHGQPFMTVDDFPVYRSSFLQHLRAMRRLSELLIL